MRRRSKLLKPIDLHTKRTEGLLGDNRPARSSETKDPSLISPLKESSLKTGRECNSSKVRFVLLLIINPVSSPKLPYL